MEACLRRPGGGSMMLTSFVLVFLVSLFYGFMMISLKTFAYLLLFLFFCLPLNLRNVDVVEPCSSDTDALDDF